MCAVNLSVFCRATVYVHIVGWNIFRHSIFCFVLLFCAVGRIVIRTDYYYLLLLLLEKPVDPGSSVGTS